MKYYLLLLGILFSASSFSQVLKGRVVTESGEAVPAASVYIIENKQGLIANDAGEFLVKLPPGNYRLEVRSLGYETNSEEINIDNEDLSLTFELKSKDVQLQEVVVQKGEDPAYEIMRQAIKKAPYYQSVVKESTYEAYSKGSGKITHIPKLMENLSGSKEEIEMYKNKLFMQESFSEIKFTAPDKYEQNVIAYSNTFPNMDDPKSALAISMASLYNPMYGGMLSPLNPKAFDYYRFRYEGYEEEGDQIINIIRIIPKLQDPKLMEGILYIADEEWNIRYADLTFSSAGITQHSKFNYHPVVNDIYLVTTFNSDVDINLLGMKMSASVLSSIQYKDIQLNDSLIAAQGKIQTQKKKEKRSLELKDDDRVKRVIDTLAIEHDSLYWEKVRTVVLNEEELKSYERKDTIQAYTDSLINAENNPKFKTTNLLMGGKLGNDSSLMYFTYSGLLRAVPEYNFVDGTWIGQGFGLDFKKKKNTGWQINPSLYWASARKAVVWKTDVQFDYAPERLGRLILSAGQTSEDFSGKEGMTRLLNSAYSSWNGKNYAKLYGKDYVSLSNQIDVGNGLQLTIGSELTKRYQLNNHTTWNLLGKKNNWMPNVPEYNKPLNALDGDFVRSSVRLKYTPEYYYRIREGKKDYVRSRFPTFELDYQMGRELELSATQDIKLGLFSRLNYTLIAGKFLRNNPLNYIDYKHFNVANPGVSFKDPNISYALLPYYTYSTNKEWIQAFVNYKTDYLLLKRLPFLQGKMFTECLQAKFLYTPDKKSYSEWGYSVDLPMGLGGVGVFASFDSFDYNSFGVQFSIPLIGLISGKGSQTITVSIGE